MEKSGESGTREGGREKSEVKKRRAQTERADSGLGCRGGVRFLRARSVLGKQDPGEA